MAMMEKTGRRGEDNSAYYSTWNWNWKCLKEDEWTEHSLRGKNFWDIDICLNSSDAGLLSGFDDVMIETNVATNDTTTLVVISCCPRPRVANVGVPTLMIDVLRFLQRLKSWSMDDDSRSMSIMRVVFFFDKDENLLDSGAKESMRVLIQAARSELPKSAQLYSIEGVDAEHRSFLTENRYPKTPDDYKYINGVLHRRSLNLIIEKSIEGSEITGPILVTGGVDKLIMKVLDALIVAGASVIIFACSPGQRDEWMDKILKELESFQGVKVLLECFDISKEDNVIELLKNIRESHGKLFGVVHVAGVSTKCTFPKQSKDSMRLAWEPRADAAWFLHKHTLQDNLQQFIMLSPASSMFGKPSLVQCSAASAYLLGLIHYRRSLDPKLPGTIFPLNVSSSDRDSLSASEASNSDDDKKGGQEVMPSGCMNNPVDESENDVLSNEDTVDIPNDEQEDEVSSILSNEMSDEKEDEHGVGQSEVGRDKTYFQSVVQNSSIPGLTFENFVSISSDTRIDEFFNDAGISGQHKYDLIAIRDRAIQLSKKVALQSKRKRKYATSK